MSRGDDEAGVGTEAHNGAGESKGSASPPLAGVVPATLLKSSLPRQKLGPFATYVLPKGKANCGLVWMHGLGDTEEGWTDGLEEDFPIQKHLGSCRFILPRAPVQSVTSNDGDRLTSWFDFKKLPLKASDGPPRFGCSLEQALASCGRIHDAIDKIVAEGVPPERIVVGGFSQGGAMAVLSTLTCSHPIAGVIVFSGIVFFADVLEHLVTPQRRGLKVFWGHGSNDNVLDPSLQTAGVQSLSEAGLQVTSKNYKTAHSSTLEEMKDAATFFAEVVSSASTV